MQGKALFFSLALSGTALAGPVVLTDSNGQTQIPDAPCCPLWSLPQGTTCQDSCQAGPIDPATDGAQSRARWSGSQPTDCKAYAYIGTTMCNLSPWGAAIDSKAAWESGVELDYGLPWADWSIAEDRSTEWSGWGFCAQRIGRPCKAGTGSDDPGGPAAFSAVQGPVDVNNDGLSDIIFVGQGWSGPGLNIRTKFSNGDGTYSAVSAVLGDGPEVHDHPTLTGDMNGDGRTDLVFLGEGPAPSWDAPPTLRIRTKFSNGDGTWNSTVFDVGVAPLSAFALPVLIGDVNGDDRDDIIMTVAGASDLHTRAYLSSGDGTYVFVQDVFLGAALIADYPAFVGEINGDNQADLIFPYQHTDGSGLNIRILQSNGDGTFTQSNQALGDGISVHDQTKHVGDIDGDGLSDVILVGNWFGDGLWIRVKQADGMGGWIQHAQFMGDGPGVHTHPALVADFTGDGNDDIVFIGQNWNGLGLNIRLKKSNGDGSWSASWRVLGDGPGVHTYPPLAGHFSTNDNRADIALIGQGWSGTGLNIRTKLAVPGENWNPVSQVMGDGPGVHTHPALCGALD
jgi:hypothetical protein